MHPMSEKQGPRADAGDPADHRNEVVLTGRVTAEPSVRELSGGDRIVTWRLTVDRADSGADAFTCVGFTADLRDATRDWRIGDVVRVDGALRRRFRRSHQFAGGIVEVEAASVRLLGRGAD